MDHGDGGIRVRPPVVEDAARLPTGAQGEKHRIAEQISSVNVNSASGTVCVMGVKSSTFPLYQCDAFYYFFFEKKNNFWFSCCPLPQA